MAIWLYRVGIARTVHIRMILLDTFHPKPVLGLSLLFLFLFLFLSFSSSIISIYQLLHTNFRPFSLLFDGETSHSPLPGTAAMPPGEMEPLLPRFEEESTTQRRVRLKLRTYQKLRALSEGYMPSTDQTIAHLRYVLASDVLNHRNQDVGVVGRQILLDCRNWFQVLIDFLHNKNSNDQLQEFLWHLSRSRASLDTAKLSRQASTAETQAETKAGTSLAPPSLEISR